MQIRVLLVPQAVAYTPAALASLKWQCGGGGLAKSVFAVVVVIVVTTQYLMLHYQARKLTYSC